MPITSTATRGWAAIERTSKIAVGVSIIAQIAVSDPPAASSAAATVSTSARLAIFGITTADGRAAPAAAMSSAPQGVASPLQRIVSSRPPYSPEPTAVAAAARAAGLASGATASSRSKMIASHGIVLALSSALAFEDGM